MDKRGLSAYLIVGILAGILILVGIIMFFTSESPELITSSKCISLVNNGPSKDKVDLVFIPNGYSNLSDFRKDVKRFTEQGLFTVEPFKSENKKFNINMAMTPQDLKCKYSGYIFCDTEGVQKKGSICSNDLFIVLTERSKIKDTFSHLRSVAYMNFIFLNTADDELVLAHELGHALFHLADEYVVPKGKFPEELPLLNCKKSCDQLKAYGLKNISCQEGCTHSHFYRASKESIMKSYKKSDKLGTLNEHIARKWLKQFS